ncbi:hypothetical protein ATO6_08505 [Oceanicola sp. 22II-s10i]|uniref:SRPBCC family protein n=1 Tax=Oceanicola sp. 22II-s10i TaxID=1317116 RepID=UPI000B5282B5|nr:SRPBCC domain-containing protein [Oceanicola sp. 22II-s10i]OWU85083.1 hypothetical protein ATO6_08505 [Oceanicola sp. 22II-s10i]
MTLELALKVSRTIPAAPDKVFDAWLDPQVMQRFMCPGAQRALRVSNDPRVGGRFDILMVGSDGKEIPHWGEYREISRPSRLVFTWNSPHAEPDSVVELTFARDGAGTLVTLVHDRFPSEGSRNGHEQGWTGILEKLDAVFA